MKYTQKQALGYTRKQLEEALEELSKREEQLATWKCAAIVFISLWVMTVGLIMSLTPVV